MITDVNRTLNAQKCRDEIREPVVRPLLNSPEGQDMIKMTVLDHIVLASSRNTQISRTSLVYHGRDCRWILTIQNTLCMSSVDVLKRGSQPYPL